MTRTNAFYRRILVQVTAFIFTVSGLSKICEATTENDLANFGATIFTLSSNALVSTPGSLGSLGLEVGFGQKYLDKQSPQEAETAGIYRNKLGIDTSRLNILTFRKGLPIPIDLIAAGGVTPDAALQTWTIGAQGTIFEGFRLPSLSIRSTFGRAHSADLSDYKSWGVAILAGYEFLGRIGIYLGREYRQGSASMNNNFAQLFLNEFEKTTDLELKTWNTTIGFHFTALYPYYRIGLEREYLGARNQSTDMFKFSVKI